MKNQFSEYLNNGKRIINALIKEEDIDKEEYQSIISAFTAELKTNLCSVDRLKNPELVIYEASIIYVDSVINRIIQTPVSTIDECQNAINLCERQKKNIINFANNKWELPHMQCNIDNTINYLNTKKNDIIFAEKAQKDVAATDKKISKLLKKLSDALNIEDCKSLIELVDQFKEQIRICEKKHISLPSLQNNGISILSQKAYSLLIKAEETEKLHAEIISTDNQLSILLSSEPTIPENKWAQILDTSRKQQNQLLKWDGHNQISIKYSYEKLSKIIRQINHYRSMMSIDTVIENHVVHSIPLSQDILVSNLNDQKKNIRQCIAERWPLPPIKHDSFKIEALISEIDCSIRREERRQRIYNKLPKIIISSVAIIIFVVIVCIVFRNVTTVSTKDILSVDTKAKKETVLSKFNELGLSNVDYIELKDIETFPNVKNDTIDHIEYVGVDINEESRIKKDTQVKIYYHSLSDNYKVILSKESSEFQLMEYESAREILSENGFTNISTKVDKVLTIGNVDKIGKVRLVQINGNKDYSVGTSFAHNSEVLICTLDYTDAAKAIVSRSASDCIGVKESIISEELQNSGFVNFKYKADKDITNEDQVVPNTIKSISIGERYDFMQDEMFPRDMEIVITTHEYSDDYKISIPKKASKYEGENYKEVVKELEALGFRNIGLSIDNDPGFFDDDNEIKSISIDGISDFKEGDAFPWNSKIEITYYSE